MLITFAVAFAAAATNVQELKVSFRLQAARANRGFFASPTDRATLTNIAEELEATARGTESWVPTASPDLLGRWYLDFTDASDVLALPFLPPLALAEVGEIYQEISRGPTKEGFVATNAVEVLPRGVGFLSTVTSMRQSGLYSIEAACRTLSASKLSLACVGGSLQPLVSPVALPAIGGSLPAPMVSWIQRAFGDRVFLETTYLDEDLRIGRGPGKELYVLSKRSDSGETGQP
jgi:hypothetical protein